MGKEGLTKEKIHEYMHVQVSAHKQLAGGIEFIEAIPKSASGKILRKDLLKMYNDSLIPWFLKEKEIYNF